MKALILVGGYGTRLRPLTLSCPKPLVDFCNKPMILHQIEALVAVGVTEVVLAVNYQPEKMMAFLEKQEKELGIKITTSQEFEPLGTAGPIKLAEKYLNDSEPFFVLNSDVSCDYPFEKMIEFQKETGAGGVLLATPVDDPSKFGVILYDDHGKIESFVEKPKEFISRFINAGIYYLTPGVFDRIELRPTSIEKEVFPQMASEGLLYAMELKGFWADVGQPKDYLAGQTMRLAAFEVNNREMLAHGPGIEGNVLVHAKAIIKSGAVVGPDVVVGEGCVIEEGARVKSATLLKGAHVGAHAYVNKSIVGWASRIGKWARVDNHSVLGEDVSVADEVLVNESIVLPHKGVKSNLATKTIVL
ncbi:mannose-1-phosphate guanylyltransferase [Chondrus crispus]|uniref:mannose-1-phosphate guanylyltransferase n=1 Tax=Chondrus crispus TaxID=2769 RepID=R7QR72_CHOCR|nr:mannose-1-phosphate guanylyltransferase [Chondrus crispus]CDF40263.1 mannose-1-phosphate guanylyltransferase [Chondrus crispus]|eukprot:XP_005710557.1 mannose-1-phosphate guanylyltransferase [Chondrus crispus]